MIEFKAIKKNSSLLPVGLKSTRGKFQRGDCIEIVFQGTVVAVGLAEYSHTQIEKIKGVKSQELKLHLLNPHSKVIIHKNNLLLK